MAASEIEELVYRLGRHNDAALAEVRRDYGEAVEQAISRARTSGHWECVKLDGAEVHAHPEEGRIAWFVNSARDGLEIWGGMRRADGRDDKVVFNPRLERLPPKMALAYLVDEHLQNLRIERRERRKYQYVELLLDLLRDTGKPDGVPWTKDRLQGAIDQASEFVERLWSVCQRTDDYEECSRDEADRYRLIWKHPDLMRAFKEGFTSKEACPLDRFGISDLADAYLRQELRSPKFELLLVDALVATEVYSYGEELKQHPSRHMKAFSLKTFVVATNESEDYREAKGNLDKLWTWMKRGLKWVLIRAAFLYGVPIGVAWLAAVNNQGEIAFAAGAFVAVLIAYGLLSWVWRKLRSLFQEPAKEPLVKMFELHAKMALLAYNELKDGTSSSPQRVREVLAQVADEGAAWDPRVFSILDAAIARSRGNWG
jgi:hypothetical protein